MNERRFLFQSRPSVKAINALVFLGILILSAWAFGYKTQNQQLSSGEINEQEAKLKLEDVPLGNKTQSLIIVDAKKDNDHINVVLKNTSQKTVTGYDVGVGIGTIGTECLTGDDERNVIHPGDVRQEVYPMQSGIKERGIVILAVMFDDGSSEGDLKSLQYMREYRLGMKIHRERALRLLQNPLNLSADISEILTNLESQSSFLSEDELKKLPPNVELGFSAERSRFTRNIESLKHNLEHTPDTSNNNVGDQTRVEAQKRLTTLIERYARTISKL